jgi:D-threonate/D-erythronate kinase
MPRRLPYLVIADDLTGAAELAALAHQAGLRAAVHRGVPRRMPAKVDVLVCDSATRLLSSAAAARRVGILARQLHRFPNAGIFKKTDSVLRGNVVAEIQACMRALKRTRALMVPCNPSLGRIVNQGRYSIAGQPIHRTAFARDPHHPRKSAQISKLLKSGGASIPCLHPADALPPRGIALGEASSPADVALWASKLDEKTLPAGGADFFRMWLVQLRAVRASRAARPALARLSTLVLSGTTATASPISPLTSEPFELHARAIPTPSQLAALATSRLQQDSSAAIATNAKLTPRFDHKVNAVFARSAVRLRDAKSFEHLLVAGATTASAVLDALGWSQLEVVHVWGPGAVTLRPVESPRLLITVKPGSYAWPLALRRHFAPQVPPRSCSPALSAAR